MDQIPSPNKLKQELGKPTFRAPWAMEADVVKALLQVLDSPAPTLERMVDAIVANEVIRTSSFDVKQRLRKLLKEHYGEASIHPSGDFSSDSARQFRAALEEQAQWLASQHNLPPSKYFSRIGGVEHQDAMRGRYGPRPARDGE